MKKILYTALLGLILFGCKSNPNVGNTNSETNKQNEEDITDSNQKGLSNNWTIVVGETQIIELIATNDGGCVFSSLTTVKGNYNQDIPTTFTYNLNKVDSFGQLEFKIQIPENPKFLTRLRNGNFFLVSTKEIDGWNKNVLQIYGSNGDLIDENYFQTEGVLHTEDYIHQYKFGDFVFHKVIETKTSDLILVGSYFLVKEYSPLSGIKKGFAMKLNSNLDIIQQEIFGAEEKYYSDGCGTSYSPSEFMDVVEASNGNFYFTGYKTTCLKVLEDSHLWIGEFDENFKLLWEKFDYNFGEKNGNAAESGNSVVISNNNELIVTGQYRGNAGSEVILINTDKKGKVIWYKNYTGNPNVSNAIKHNNFIYLFIPSKKIYKLSLQGTSISETNTNVDYLGKIINSNQNCFFTIGYRNENGDKKWYLSRYNSNGELGDIEFDYSRY